MQSVSSSVQNKDVRRIRWVDFWPGFDETQIPARRITAHPQIEVVKTDSEADLTIASVFSNEKLSSSKPVITISWECYQRWIRYRPLAYRGASYMFLNNTPNSIPELSVEKIWPSSVAVNTYHTDSRYPESRLRAQKLTVETLPTGFASYVYSNACPDDEGAMFRQDFFHELSKYKRVSSAGPALNNEGMLLPRSSAIESAYYQRHRFNIAMENTSAPGYVTEKIFHAYLNNSVPIYWGHPSILEQFNPESMIYAHTVNQGVADVIRMDSDPHLLLKTLQTPPFETLPPEYSQDHFINTLTDLILNTPIDE